MQKTTYTVKSQFDSFEEFWHSSHHLKANGEYPKQIAEKFENVSDEVSMGW